MRLSDIRTMKGMKGGGIAMQSLETQCAVRAWRLVRRERGLDPVAVEVDLLRQEQVFQGEEAPRPANAGCGLLGEAFARGNWGVDSVHTLGHGLGRTGAGLARIPHVSAGSQCLQGLEFGSSPTSGTVFSHFSGYLGVFACAHCAHLASDLMFRVCGVPDRPIRLCGGAAAYGGRGTALWGTFWVFIFVLPSLGFSRSPLHGGQNRLQHDLLVVL